MKNFKQKISQQILSNSVFKNLLFFLVTSSLFGCLSTSNLNDKRIIDYENKLKNYSCGQLESENSYVERNINLMESQLKKSSLDTFMESIISIGIFCFSGERSLKKNIDYFKQKKAIINQLKEKNCHA